MAREAEFEEASPLLMYGSFAFSRLHGHLANRRLFHVVRRARGWIVLMVVSGVSAAASSTDQLKKLSIEDLMQVEVTSVLRAPTALNEAPSA